MNKLMTLDNITNMRKYISEQRRLSSGSAFVRVLIVITWVCVELSFLLTQAHLAYEAAFGAILYGIPAALLWFTVGNIHTVDTIEWTEYIETEGSSAVEEIKSEEVKN